MGGEGAAGGGLSGCTQGFRGEPGRCALCVVLRVQTRLVVESLGSGDAQSDFATVAGQPVPEPFSGRNSRSFSLQFQRSVETQTLASEMEPSSKKEELMRCPKFNTITPPSPTPRHPGGRPNRATGLAQWALNRWAGLIGPGPMGLAQGARPSRARRDGIAPCAWRAQWARPIGPMVPASRHWAGPNH